MSTRDFDRVTLAFFRYFSGMEDSRQPGKVLYPLNEIFLLVLCAVISGADGWASIALYGRKKISLLRRFLPYENGTPSHDQLGVLFLRLDMEAFQRCFAAWVSSPQEALEEALGGVVAIDDAHSSDMWTPIPIVCGQ
jgi:hypothetical protein